MKTKMNLNEEELVNVCGGDMGDAQRDEDENHSMYEVGQTVERYSFPLHFWTVTCKITGKKIANGHWYYSYNDNGTQWIDANSIQSN